MPFLTILLGGLLVNVGLIGYLNPTIFGTFDKISPTALIPAFIGGAIALCGLATLIKPAVRKQAMHFAALVGVIGVLGGFMPLGRSDFDFQKASAMAGVFTIGLSLAFVMLCVGNFLGVRQVRRQQPPIT